MNILNDINTMSCPIKVNSNTIELTVHTSCYCVLDLLCSKTGWSDIKVAKFFVNEIVGISCSKKL